MGKELCVEEDGEDKFSIKQVAEEQVVGGSHFHYEHQYDCGTGCRICSYRSTYLFSHEYICI